MDRRIGRGKVYIVSDPGEIYAEGRVCATAVSYRVVAATPEDIAAIEAGKRVTERLKNDRKSSDRKR